MPNTYVNKVTLSNGTTLIDLTSDTVTSAAHIVSGRIGHLADGSQVTGTGSGGGAASIEDVPNTTGTTAAITGVIPEYGTKTITVNGTYSAEDDDLDGYSEVTVNVPSSGGGSTDGGVKFIDYDGTVVQSYSASEFASLTAMPTNPTHTGLIAQGWNWSLSDAKTYVAKHGKLVIGQMYKTASGKTEIDVTFDDPKFLSPYLEVCPNGTITIDWGDGSATETMTGTSYTSRKYLQHVYPRIGSYTISIDGNVGFYTTGNSYTTVLLRGSSGSNDRLYSKGITAIRLNETSRIGHNAFCYLNSLTSITIPDSVTSIGNAAFYYCYSLASLVIPDGVTSIGANAFQYCYSLTSITIPDGVTSIGSSTFASSYSLTSITIPDGVTSIGTNAFYSCYSLASLVIPDSVTSIGNSVFQYCYVLASLTIPDSVTSIGNNAFNGCYSMQEYHFLSTTPPTLGTTAFNNIKSYTVIYVPQGSLEAYQTATNWSTYASYMQEEVSA